MSERVCVRIIIYAMSWNSYSENPFHRKNDLIEFELTEWIAASSFVSVLGFFSFPRSLLSPRLFLYFIFARCCGLLNLQNIGRVWNYGGLAHSFCIIQAREKRSITIPLEIFKYANVSQLVGFLFFFLSIDLSNYLSAFSFAFLTPCHSIFFCSIFYAVIPV